MQFARSIAMPRADARTDPIGQRYDVVDRIAPIISDAGKFDDNGARARRQRRVAAGPAMRKAFPAKLRRLPAERARLIPIEPDFTPVYLQAADAEPEFARVAVISAGVRGNEDFDFNVTSAAPGGSAKASRVFDTQTGSILRPSARI